MCTVNSNRASRRRVPRSSQSWCAYFAANAARQPELPWAGNAGLILREREAIARSVQRFQLGETGTGRRFLEKCRRHAQRTGDLEYVEAVQRFLAEEHRHAAILGRFLDLACLPRLQRHWTDGAFRRLRHLAGLGTVVAVLLVAETIAKVYYAALRDATRSPLLTAICRCILRDEVRHVEFQAERLARLWRARPRVVVCAIAALHTGLFWGTSVVVWWTHCGVFRAAGLSYRSYVVRLQRAWHTTRRLMDPRRYDFGEAEEPATGWIVQAAVARIDDGGVP
jgi:hypothetical protein